MSERLAIAGLWSIPGVGPKTIARARELGPLEDLAQRPAREWVGALRLPRNVRALISPDARFLDLGEQLLARARRLGISVAFQGDRAYPPLLVGLEDAPPLLFHWGPGADVAPRRRVAMVGTRAPDQAFWRQARDMASAVAGFGLGVVSGAARGIDSWCHLSAAWAPGETWAFVGSALDQLDPSPRRLWRRIEGYQATFFSEFPLGVRAEKTTFPRRNRLISGAADAVLVLRADFGSGTRHTVDYAKKQGKKVLAIPGDPADRTARLCNHYLRSQEALTCLSPFDVVKAAGVTTQASHKPRPHFEGPVNLDGVSPRALELLPRVPREIIEIDALMLEPGFTSGDIVSALFELELKGLVLRHGGGRVQRM